MGSGPPSLGLGRASGGRPSGRATAIPHKKGCLPGHVPLLLRVSYRVSNSCLVATACPPANKLPALRADSLNMIDGCCLRVQDESKVPLLINMIDAMRWASVSVDKVLGM